VGIALNPLKLLNIILHYPSRSQGCYCGNSIRDINSPANVSLCNLKCDGDRTQICGGSGRINGYSIYYSVYQLENFIQVA